EVMCVETTKIDACQQTLEISRKLVQTNRDSKREDSLPRRIGNEIYKFLEAIVFLSIRFGVRDVALKKQRHPARISVEDIRARPRLWIGGQILDRAASEFEDQYVAIIVVTA